MPNSEIQELVKSLIQQVRDASIRSCDQALNPNSMDPVAKRWRKSADSKNLKGVATVLIPDVVDEVIFNLLDAIDNGHLKLTFTASNGKRIDLPKDGLGELSGWYMGSGGWRAMYSKERFADDFSDLR